MVNSRKSINDALFIDDESFEYHSKAILRLKTDESMLKTKF